MKIHSLNAVIFVPDVDKVVSFFQKAGAEIEPDLDHGMAEPTVSLGGHSVTFCLGQACPGCCFVALVFQCDDINYWIRRLQESDVEYFTSINEDGQYEIEYALFDSLSVVFEQLDESQ